MRKRYLAVGCVAMGSLVTVCLCIGCIGVWQSFIPPEFWHSEYPSISADGRYVAFESDATNLVPGDTNDSIDIFVHDRETGQRTRVSVASDGSQGNENSRHPSISADGRYVAFESWASLAPGDTNRDNDIFVHDRHTGQTTPVSVTSDGTQGDSHSGDPSISADGRYVAFSSWATNLVPGDTGNTCDTDRDGVYDENCRDVFVHDRQTGQTTRVSPRPDIPWWRKIF